MSNTMKTLYVSDLDGTLLNSNVELSQFTVKAINSLVEKGMNFTFATARSLNSSKEITKDLKLNIPVIVYNGAFIMDKETGKIFSSSAFAEEEKNFVIDKINQHKVNPLVYSFINGKESVSYNKNYVNKGVQLYLDSRKNDSRMTPLDNDNLYNGDVFYFTIIDKKNNIEKFYNSVRENKNLRVTFQQDIYNEYYWCEIMPKSVSKANGIILLKNIYGFDKVVSFGDAINDISMFKISDESYAVENAVEELKQISTKEILSNNNDGVAKFLLDIFNKG